MASSLPPPSAHMARPPEKSPVPLANSNGPQGLFAPGTKVQVGSHRVIVEKYLSEGGFAHVYVVRAPMAGGRMETAVLKRVAVPDKDALANMRTEVETMKKLRGHQKIVTYIDSHASQLKGGGYEVFLLMEYCDGGGLIDFMNTRLKNRLTEPEILKIFSDVAEGVACMHYLKPPLIHRDLKVENVLISTAGSSKTFKLCDFGSSAPPRPAATNSAERRLIEDDVQRHTTMQYRSPEMVDVYRQKPIDEKSDIWALGVLLYKLCYYTTPFEAQGQMAILTASFKYPSYPPFSDRTKKLIADMLTEDPSNRPNIYTVLKQVCAMRGKEVPVKDIYASRTLSESKGHQKLPPREVDIKSPPIIGASHAAPQVKKAAIPEVTPMRRGRPTAQDSKKESSNTAETTAKGNTDPFAALDSASFAKRSAAVNELSARYPALDDFSLLQDKSSKFQFKVGSKEPPKEDMKQRITNALADEAFSNSRDVTEREDSQAKPLPNLPKDTSTQRSKQPETVRVTSLPPIKQPKPERPAMVSTGTMTSSSPPPPPKDFKQPKVSSRPIWRVPSPSSRDHRFTMGLLNDEPSDIPVTPVRRGTSPHGLSFQQPQSPVSSRPSLEGMRSPHLDVKKSVHRSKSAETQSRRSSEDWGKSPPFALDAEPLAVEDALDAEQFDERENSGEESNITSDVDFLRAMEEEDSAKSHHHLHHHHHRRHSARQSKRRSLPSASTSGKRNLLGGKFGDALRRFEGGSHRQSHNDSPPQTAQPERAISDNESEIDETEDLSPEMRRELERRRLSQEERRVAEAAAAYRQRLAQSDDSSAGRSYAAGPSRASAIQDRVKHLLDESGRDSPVKRTAEGYGRYTDAEPPAALQGPSNEDIRTVRAVNVNQRTVKDDGPIPSSSAPPDIAVSPKYPQPGGSTRLVPIRGKGTPGSKPAAPPKPVALRTDSVSGPGTTSADAPAEEVYTDFSKRYPSLSLEMVETEIAKTEKPISRPIRVKEV